MLWLSRAVATSEAISLRVIMTEDQLQERRRTALQAATMKFRNGVQGLGAALGYSNGEFLKQMLKGRRRVTEKTVAKIEALPGFEGWYAEGGALAVIAHADAEPHEGGTPIRIKRFRNGTSAGPGQDVLPEDALAGELVVYQEWLDRNVHPRPTLGRLAFITAYGDSMAPKIMSGNILLIDTGHVTPDVNGIYVLEANHQLFVKRISRRLDGRIVVTSDNEPNVAEELRGDSPVTIKGRVVYVWKGESL